LSVRQLSFLPLAEPNLHFGSNGSNWQQGGPRPWELFRPASSHPHNRSSRPVSLNAVLHFSPPILSIENDKALIYIYRFYFVLSFQSWNSTQITAPISMSFSSPLCFSFSSEVFKAANPHQPALGTA